MMCVRCKKEMKLLKDHLKATNNEMTDGVYLDLYVCENCGIIVETNKREFK